MKSLLFDKTPNTEPYENVNKFRQNEKRDRDWGIGLGVKVLGMSVFFCKKKNSSVKIS